MQIQESDSPVARRRKSERGYNIFEVIVATAVLGVVLLSVVTLFVVGRRNVYSGKQMSAANAIATRVLEDLSLMTASDVIEHFALAGLTPTNNTIAGETYANSIVRDTAGTVTTGTDPAGYLARWQSLVDEMNELPRGRIVLVVMPSQPIDATRRVATAQIVRIRTIVEWNEGQRRRNVFFDASKLQRP